MTHRTCVYGSRKMTTITHASYSYSTQDDLDILAKMVCQSTIHFLEIRHLGRFVLFCLLTFFPVKFSPWHFVHVSFFPVIFCQATFCPWCILTMSDNLYPWHFIWWHSVIQPGFWLNHQCSLVLVVDHTFLVPVKHINKCPVSHYTFIQAFPFSKLVRELLSLTNGIEIEGTPYKSMKWLMSVNWETEDHWKVT